MTKFVPYSRPFVSEAEMLKKSVDNYLWLNQRRTVRDIANTPVAKEVIDNLLLSAGTAPSGAHKQPWTFCAVSNLALKNQIRAAAEKEEKESYENRMSEEWLAGLVTLTHTPSPMGFLSQLLGRPENERPFLLLPVGYPKSEAMVPNLHRKSLNEIAVYYE